jgi:CRP/FNR family transcriptional regulator, cyclic AMP receptor protein
VSHGSTTAVRENELLATLRCTTAFGCLTATAAAEVLRAMSRLRLKPGSVVFREQDPGSSLYVVVSGAVKLGRASPGGREILVAVLWAKEVFGELSVIDAAPRTMTATALGDVLLLELSGVALERLYGANPHLRIAMLRALARRVHEADEMLSGLVFRDAAGRLAKALLDLADRHGRETSGGVFIVEHGMTQTDLANLVGSTRETVNRLLREFAIRGWIQVEGRSTHVTDVDGLRRRAGLDRVFCTTTVDDQLISRRR